MAANRPSIANGIQGLGCLVFFIGLILMVAGCLALAAIMGAVGAAG